MSHQSGDPAGCCHPRHAWVQLGHPRMFGRGAWGTHRVCSIPVPIMGSPPQGMGAQGVQPSPSARCRPPPAQTASFQWSCPRCRWDFGLCSRNAPGSSLPSSSFPSGKTPGSFGDTGPASAGVNQKQSPPIAITLTQHQAWSGRVSAQGTPALPPPSPPAAAPSCFPQEPISSRDGFTHEPKLTAPRERGNEAINQHTVLSVPCVRDAAGDLPRAGRS